MKPKFVVVGKLFDDGVVEYVLHRIDTAATGADTEEQYVNGKIKFTLSEFSDVVEALNGQHKVLSAEEYENWYKTVDN